MAKPAKQKNQTRPRQKEKENREPTALKNSVFNSLIRVTKRINKIGMSQSVKFFVLTVFPLSPFRDGPRGLSSRAKSRGTRGENGVAIGDLGLGRLTASGPREVWCGA